MRAESGFKSHYTYINVDLVYRKYLKIWQQVYYLQVLRQNIVWTMHLTLFDRGVRYIELGGELIKTPSSPYVLPENDPPLIPLENLLFVDPANLAENLF